ncbi:hypothetical protein ACSZN3_22775 [Aeromonas hydrophila]|uniref:DNA-binding protein n=1 Tax=Aeromonas TaxID=642 RepID=UPI0030DBD90B
MSKRKKYTEAELMASYQQTGSLRGMAELLAISYPTAVAWAAASGLPIKRQGYTPPIYDLTGAQCRHARECLGLTRNDFLKIARVSLTCLREFELSKSIPRRAQMDMIINAFDYLGVCFSPDGLFEIRSDKP